MRILPAVGAGTLARGSAGSEIGQGSVKASGGLARGGSSLEGLIDRRAECSLAKDEIESGEGGVNLGGGALQCREGAIDLFVVSLLRLRFQLASEAEGMVRAERPKRAEQRVRGAGELGSVAAGDGAADRVEQLWRILMEQRDHPLHQRFVAIELIEKFFAREDQLCWGGGFGNRGLEAIDRRRQ